MSADGTYILAKSDLSQIFTVLKSFRSNSGNPETPFANPDRVRNGNGFQGFLFYSQTIKTQRTAGSTKRCDAVFQFSAADTLTDCQLFLTAGKILCLVRISSF